MQTLDGTDTANMVLVKKLVALNPDHVESQTLLAEMAMKVGNSSLAEESLTKALEANAGVRQYRLMAEFEESRGNKDAAREWLLKASEANPDPQWTCGSCGAATDEWEAACPSCGAFGALDWRRPLRFVHLTDQSEGKADEAA
jgi:HemY protein